LNESFPATLPARPGEYKVFGASLIQVRHQRRMTTMAGAG
jgi:hypothetical protein